MIVDDRFFCMRYKEDIFLESGFYTDIIPRNNKTMLWFLSKKCLSHRKGVQSKKISRAWGLKRNLLEMIHFFRRDGYNLTSVGFVFFALRVCCKNCALRLFFPQFFVLNSSTFAGRRFHRGLHGSRGRLWERQTDLRGFSVSPMFRKKPVFFPPGWWTSNGWHVWESQNAAARLQGFGFFWEHVPSDLYCWTFSGSYV